MQPCSAQRFPRNRPSRLWKAVHIRNFAGHIKRHDCASAVWQYLLSAKKALHEKAALGGTFALADNVFIRLKVLTWTGKSRMVFRSCSETVVTFSSFRISRLSDSCGIYTSGGSTRLPHFSSARKTVGGDKQQRIIEHNVPESMLSCIRARAPRF